MRDSAFATLDSLDAKEALFLVQAAGIKHDEITTTDARLRVFDLHCDTLDRLVLVHDADNLGGFAAQFAGGNLDRMQTLAENDAHISLDQLGKYAWCQCFAIFVPDELDADDSWSFCDRIYRYFLTQMQACQTQVTQVCCASEITDAFAERKTAALLTIEGAPFLSPRVDSESRLDTLVDMGVGMVALTWNGENAMGSGYETNHGLSSFGRSMVAELEARSIVLDVSHLNDEGFKDVCRVATKPFAASHSNCRSVCDHARNLADWQLREIADRKGVVGLNFCRDFLSTTHSLPTHTDVLRHVDHILEVAGEDVLALGSDYDGCDVPLWLEPCSKVGDLFELLSDEFGEAIAHKIFFENAYAFFERIRTN